MTLSLEPPGILRSDLPRQVLALGRWAARTRPRLPVCKAAAALEVRPEQSSILRCNFEILGAGAVAFPPWRINNSAKLCFIIARRLVSQRAVESPLNLHR